MRKLFLTALLSIMALPAFAAEKNEDVFDRVMRTRTIQCAYVLYEPVMMKDPKTEQLSGIIYDLMEEIGKRVHMKIEWSESSYATYSEDIKRPDVDLFCGTFWTMAETAQFGAVSVPLWYSGIGIYVRADDTRFDKDYTKLNNENITISAVDGTIPMRIALQDFPKAKILSAPALSDYLLNLLNVSNGKADVTFVELSQAAAFSKNNPGKLKNIIPEAPIHTYANSVMVRMGETKMWLFMNAALTELVNEGFVDKVLDKYDPEPHTLYRVYKPYEALQ